MTDTALVIRDPLTTIAPARVDQQPALVYLARLAPGSRRTMRQALDSIARLLTGDAHDAETLPWSALRYQHTAAVRAQLAATYAPATASKMLAALRGTLRECWRLGLIDAEGYHRTADLPGIKSQALPRGRALAAGEIRALLEACAQADGPAGVRDAAIIAVMYPGGLRRSEVTALDLADYDREAGALTVRSGKGGKDRISYAADVGSRAALTDWLELRGLDPGPLFLPIDKAGRIHHRRLTGQAVLAILQRRATAAGVSAFSPHDLRRSTISDLLDAGADIATVQKLAGHANVTTTARYDRRGEATKRRAAELLHLPYRRGRAGVPGR